MKRVKNKSLISLLAVAEAFSLTACTSQADIDNTVPTPVIEQIAQMDEHIDGLESEIEMIESDLAAANVELETLQGKINGLETNVETLENTITDLQDVIEELEIRINCLEGKHVINEAETVSYVYTWSETAPTSIQNYTCLHCEKAIEEAVSPNIWEVGDKVTYVAKDGNSYISTVGEKTDGKAVIVTDTDYSVEGYYGETAQLELLETVGARFPIIGEATYTTIIKPWIEGKITYYNETLCFVYKESDDNCYYIYRSSDDTLGCGDAWDMGRYERTWIYRYIWDIPFATAE